MKTEDTMGKAEEAIAKISYRSQTFPGKEFQIITENKEETIPYLRNSLEKAIQEQMNLNEDYQLHFYALFLLGQFQDTESFQKIVELVSLPPKVVDYLIGDTITSGLPDILYNTYVGNLEQLKQMITDKEIDEFVRGDALEVIGQLYLAYQRASEMAFRENVISFEDFDKKHSIHYRCEEWTGKLLKLLKDAGDYAAYQEVADWAKEMQKK